MCRKNKLLVRFQSTLPQGERPRKSTMTDLQQNFNPRSHKGSDVTEVSRQNVKTISIHAPTRGATEKCTGYNCKMAISIHAPTRGATLQVLQESKKQKISIHAPTRGATAIFPNFRPCITLNIPKFYQYHSFFLIICS